MARGGSTRKLPAKMHKIVERIMLSAKTTSYSLQGELRNKVFGYVELLFSTGKRDPEELVTLGGEYLRKIEDGPDRRFTGC